MDNETKPIQEAIMKEKYSEAEQLLIEYVKDKGIYDDVIAIFEGSIAAYYGDRARMWDAIRQGLLYNCRNYELYVMLGNYYLEENLQQAYLCYENAYFYCDVDEDKYEIEQLMLQLKNDYKITMNKTAIVILSYNLLEYTRKCIESIRGTTLDSTREIIVVDNASKDGSVEWLREQEDIILIENSENKGFPAGCNQGIDAASQDADIFLLNNDTVLPANALFWLRMGLYADEKNGTAGCVSNHVTNLQQVAHGIQGEEELLKYGERVNVPLRYFSEKKIFLIGFALLIRREVLNQVGVLDERFTPGNSEDEDYGLRILKAGYQNVLCRNSFIIHFGSKSFGKMGKNFRNVLQVNRKKLDEKWGINTKYYMYPRLELVQMVDEPIYKEMRVLDIGCGCGAMIACIKGLYPNASVSGIEIVPEAAEFAKHMGEVICADVETLEFPWQEEYFDYVIMGDVLEHLKKPDIVLEKVHKCLKKDGHIVVSMPNMKHYSVILPLLIKDVFPYSNSGILDTTHLKMYTGTEIRRLVSRNKFVVEKWTHTTVDNPGGEVEKLIDQLTAMMQKPDKDSFLAYQYLVKAGKAVK